jgi:cellulose synthase/poly-beta-1,6-N-acetylglucosamine synthase-like glycosyltransferase
LNSHRWFWGVFVVFLLSSLVSPFFQGLAGWLPGVFYIFYDTFLLSYVTAATVKTIRRGTPLPAGEASPLSLSVLIAARNERAVIHSCIERILPQLRPEDELWIVNDGSTDGSFEDLVVRYDLQVNDSEAVSRNRPRLHVVDKPHSGKAHSLNLIWPKAAGDVLVTVDADTWLEPQALQPFREAFARDAKLAAACGILAPVVHPSGFARVFEMFQQFEYIRAFLARVAWMQTNSLLLVSGAFAAYRKSVLQKIGGYSASSLVEDYDLIHRLHRYSWDHGLGWKVHVLSQARAATDVPSSLFRFLKQRQRWFAGFLQTQFQNFDLVGNPAYGPLGKFMLPIKAVDMLQPLFGLAAVAILILTLSSGKWPDRPVLVLIATKLTIDLFFHFWSVALYHSWQGRTVPTRVWARSALATIFEPVSFQLLRHLGALLGWVAFLRGKHEWIPQRRLP